MVLLEKERVNSVGGTHGGLIDSTQEVIEEVRGVDEGGWPGDAMVTPLQVVEQSTSCGCGCVSACVCVS